MLSTANERMHTNVCVNKSVFQFQAFTSCPSDVTPLTVSSAKLITFSLGNSKSAGLVNAYLDSQKLDTILREPCSYYSSASAPKRPQKQSQSI